MGDSIKVGKEIGIKNTVRLVPKGLKTDPDNFYLISQEEYIMLTGIDPTI